MRVLALGLTREGMWYSFFLILVYVSFRLDVSNGGFPTNNVNLEIKSTQAECVCTEKIWQAKEIMG